MARNFCFTKPGFCRVQTVLVISEDSPVFVNLVNASCQPGGAVYSFL